MTGLAEVRPGLRVKVRGAAVEGRLHAVDVEVRPETRDTLIEACVERVDAVRRELRILGSRLALPAAVSITGPCGEPMRLEDVAARARVKVSGRYAPGTGFVAESMQVLEPLDFTIEKIQGPVEDVDAEGRTLRVMGFLVNLEPRTVFECPR